MNSVGTSVVCLTADIDWAEEWMIESLFEISDEYNIPITPFITHNSNIIKSRYSDRPEDVGVHPNFMDGSDHGTTIDEVISHIQRLWPEAKCYRAHGFMDSSKISKKMFEYGYEFDSNILLHFDSVRRPLKTAFSSWRYPVFLEDDVYFSKSNDFNFNKFIPYFLEPGIKILNFHPIHVALNTPSQSFYEDIKSAADVNQSLIHSGPGTRTFLKEVLEFSKKSESVTISSFTDLHDELKHSNHI